MRKFFLKKFMIDFILSSRSNSFKYTITKPNSNIYIYMIENIHLVIMVETRIISTVRTRFDLNPEQKWIQAHVAQTINL